MLYTERDALFQNSMKFSAHISMFWHYYLEKKKPTFLTCIPKQVYAVILESSKNDDLFQNRRTYFCQILENPERTAFLLFSVYLDS